MNKALIQYITDAKAHGLNDQEIKQNLLDAGWDAAAVEEAFTHFKVEESKASEILPKQPQPVQAAEPHSMQTAPVSITPAEPIIKEPQSVHASMSEIMDRPQMPLTAQTPVMVEESGNKSKVGIIGGIIAALILIGGGYLAYGYYQQNGSFKNFSISNLAGIFKKKAANVSVKMDGGSVYQNNFKISYHDPLTYTNSTDCGLTGNAYSSDCIADPFFSKLKDFTVSFDGKFYVDNSNPGNPQSSSNVNYTFASGNTSFSTGLEYRFIDKTFYVNVGDNPFLSSIAGNLGNGASAKISWIKLSLTDLQKNLEENSSNYTAVKEIFDPSLRTDLNKLWEDAKLVKVDSTIGKETVNGASTIHYKNLLDKEALKKFLGDCFVRLSKVGGGNVTDQDLTTVRMVISALVDKLQIKEFETWVGDSDYHLYKVHLVTNAPSLVSIIQELSKADFVNLGGASDGKRLSDVKQVSTALELYHNDHNGYPAADKNGKPLNMTPAYIGIWPTAPAPTGNCSDYYNSYWYQPSGQQSKDDKGNTIYSSYTLTFCLEHDTGTYKAGIGELSPSGIKDNIACPTQDDKCFRNGISPSETDALQKAIQDTVNKIDYSAEFRVDADYHDYGVKIKLDAPTDTFDILDALRSAQAKARDAKRLADVRQLSTALELYNNDKSDYPQQLKDLTPMYIGVLPDAPKPADGLCTDSDNSYTYTRTGSTQYVLTFCLGGQTGGYSPGKHSVSPAGIQ